MVDRQEVEALIRKAESCNELGVISGKASTLAALCRAWLAVDEAPSGHALMGRGDWVEVFNMSDDDRHAVEGQRVRIVPGPPHDP